MTTKLNSSSLSFRPIVLALLFLATNALAGAQTERAIHTFAGEPDGQEPYTTLVFDKAGNLYGTTIYGGTFNQGSIFKLTPSGFSWTETILYSFGTTSADGIYPKGALVFDAKGNLYGTTTSGRSAKGSSLFQLSPPTVSGGSWTFTVLANFELSNQGSTGPCGLLWVNGLHLFGVAPYGGNGYGSIVELAPPATSGGTWSASTIYSFSPLTRTDGYWPGRDCAPLIADKSGNLYGTTQLGGSLAWGTVFELSPPATSGGAWTETILHNFADAFGNGAAPGGPVTFDANGNLYGTASGGGSNLFGVVYELSPASDGTWTFSLLYSFRTQSDDGKNPAGGVIFDKAGNMYGTTTFGVYPYPEGTIWKLAPPSTSGGKWTETVLHSFTGGPDGGEPNAGLIAGPGGALYGTTLFGGNSKRDGVVYQLVP